MALGVGFPLLTLQFRELRVGTGGSWSWQRTLGRRNCARTIRVAVPQVLSLVGFSFYQGR